MNDALAEAVEERDVRLTFLGVEPRWDPLRKTAEFESIRQRVGLPITNANIDLMNS